MTHLAGLPVEIIVLIYEKLNTRRDVINLALAFRYMHKICFDNRLRLRNILERVCSTELRLNSTDETSLSRTVDRIERKLVKQNQGGTFVIAATAALWMHRTQNQAHDCYAPLAHLPSIMEMEAIYENKGGAAKAIEMLENIWDFHFRTEYYSLYELAVLLADMYERSNLVDKETEFLETFWEVAQQDRHWQSQAIPLVVRLANLYEKCQRMDEAIKILEKLWKDEIVRGIVTISAIDPLVELVRIYEGAEAINGEIELSDAIPWANKLAEAYANKGLLDKAAEVRETIRKHERTERGLP
jgi:tetratricopeptide (TPR) repeat protein